MTSTKRDPDAIRIVMSRAPVVHQDGTSQGIDLARIHNPKIMRNAKDLSLTLTRMHRGLRNVRFYAARFSHQDPHTYALIFTFVQRLRLSRTDFLEIAPGEAPGFAEVERFMLGDETALDIAPSPPAP